MYPLRSQENADEASPAGAFSCYIYLGPLSQDFLPPYLLGVLRELGIIDGSVKSLLCRLLTRCFLSPASPGLVATLGLRTCGARVGTRGSSLEDTDQTEGSTEGAFCLLVPGLQLAGRRDPVCACRVRAHGAPGSCACSRNHTTAGRGVTAEHTLCAASHVAHSLVLTTTLRSRSHSPFTEKETETRRG